ncbi:MAG: tyrosine-type recombinase/integrase, partial [Steroidobacteraceae bacterium]
VFVRMVPPHTQFPDSGAITTIAAKAMRAAGVDAPSKGAHVFRHTLATQMLHKGASLREIGQVLRHRDEDTTRLYAKVDLTRLRTLALPWPGGAS